MERDAAVDLVEAVVDAVEEETMPVPVREVWVYGDVALGLDPVERLNVYVTKDLLMGGDADREAEFEERYGVSGVGKTVRADWADEHPEHLRANDSGHVAPEKCLAAHLLPDDVPVHLEVCNSSFEDNVTQRLQGALARDAYEEVLDPRGVCLWVDAPASEGGGGPGSARASGGVRSEDAFRKLRNAELPFPTLPEALEMLGADAEQAERAAATLQERRTDLDGPSVRGDVV